MAALAMASKKLTPSQVAQLGGFARKKQPGALSEMGKKGGAAVKEKYGREHYIRMAHKSHGRLQS